MDKKNRYPLMYAFMIGMFILMAISVFNMYQMPDKGVSKMYFFDVNGLMQTGFISDGINTYYMAETGVMQTGMFNVGNAVYYADAAGFLTSFPVPFHFSVSWL